jgi:hypothetical protein
LTGAFLAGAFSATGAAWKIATGTAAAFLAGLTFFSAGSALAVSKLGASIAGVEATDSVTASVLASPLTFGLFLAARLRGFFGAIAIFQILNALVKCGSGLKIKFSTRVRIR